MQSSSSPELEQALYTATALLHQHLNLPIKPSPSNPDSVLPCTRVLVIGGETLIGAALVHLLHILSPSTKSLATSSIPGNTRELSRRTMTLVQLGAQYAIDGDAPDLLEHLSAAMGGQRFEWAFDVGGRLKRMEEWRREGLLGLLDETGNGERVVDCWDADGDPEAILRGMLEGGEGDGAGDFPKWIAEMAKTIEEKLAETLQGKGVDRLCGEGEDDGCAASSPREGQ